jgi:DNA polymerase delta subunit 1
LQPIPSTGAHVYDLTTRNHHFHAGVGQMIVHNTDSVMIIFQNVTSEEECTRLSAEAAAKACEVFAPLVLEFEKASKPFWMWEQKKRYVARIYEPNDSGGLSFKGIDVKGIEFVRRDALPFLKQIQGDVIDAIADKGDRELTFSVVQNHLVRLVKNEVPFHMLTLAKGVRSDYKDPSRLIQCVVNEKRRMRENGSQASTGERVEWVYVKGRQNSKACEVAEDARYAEENNIPLDRIWYLDHCIRKPMIQMLGALHGKKLDRLFDDTRAILKRDEQTGGVSLLDFQSTRNTSSSSSVQNGPLLNYRPRPPPPLPKKKRKA